MAKAPKGVAPAPPAPSKPATKATAPRSLKVRATQMGIYDNGRRREGNVFTLKSATDFRPKWMEFVDAATQERVTGPKQSLAVEHDKILGGTVASGEAGGGTGPASPGRGPDDVI